MFLEFFIFLFFPEHTGYQYQYQYQFFFGYQQNWVITIDLIMHLG
jgi:hypothetical protein